MLTLLSDLVLLPYLLYYILLHSITTTKLYCTLFWLGQQAAHSVGCLHSFGLSRMGLNPLVVLTLLVGVLVVVDLVANPLGLHGGCLLFELAYYLVLGVGLLLDVADAVKQQPAGAAFIKACFLLVDLGCFRFYPTM